VVYTADLIRKFDSKSNRTGTADSIRDSIRMQKNDSQVPNSQYNTDTRQVNMNIHAFSDPVERERLHGTDCLVVN